MSQVRPFMSRVRRAVDAVDRPPGGRRAPRLGAAVLLALTIGACRPSGEGEGEAEPEGPPSSSSSSSSSSSPPGPGEGTSSSGPPGSVAQPAGPAVTVTPYAVAGWWTGQGWVMADGSAPVPVQGGESYTVLRPNGTTTTATGSAAEEGCETNPGSTRVSVPGLDDAAWPPAVAVSGVGNPRPRPVEALSRSAPVYRQAAGELLAQRGVTDRDADVVQALRTDLDGDGTAEVLVVAERIADRQLYAQAGDYSIVFLRRVVNEVPVTTVLTESIPDPRPDETPFVQSHRVATIADLNGDGRMEVALAGRYYEGASVAVFELARDGTTGAVMLGGCGA